MPDLRGTTLRRYRKLRIASIAILCCVAFTSGCKTSDDAAAAATQMSTTAKSLSDYYTALSTILSNTDQIYSLNQQLYAKPYSSQSQQELKS